MIYGNSIGGAGLEKTYILIDDDGNEAIAVVSDERVALDANANDIRIGKTAATADGVTEGTKIIPSYNTREGTQKIQPGGALEISLFSDACHFTKLQALVCKFNTNADDSIATEKVSINGKVYGVNSVEKLSDVTVDENSKAIELNMINDSDSPVFIRFFTCKEVY